ncbi:hypothetical protein, partial [Bradyrhizobium sp. 33ap4]|uniref:hypothetical protein n=1 Tax=Bradyrhizobium sp. 33ap4 TaxID=3061630 RepID=UPI002931C19D
MIRLTVVSFQSSFRAIHQTGAPWDALCTHCGVLNERSAVLPGKVLRTPSAHSRVTLSSLLLGLFHTVHVSIRNSFTKPMLCAMLRISHGAINGIGV